MGEMVSFKLSVFYHNKKKLRAHSSLLQQLYLLDRFIWIPWTLSVQDMPQLGNTAVLNPSYSCPSSLICFAELS